MTVWLIFALTLGALAAIVWLACERRGQRTRRDDQRRTRDQRILAAAERRERRRRLGLPENEETEP